MYILTDSSSSLAAAMILVAAALLHGTFQLSVSVMTRLSGHALGRKRSHARLLHLCLSYIAGNLLMITLLILGALYILSSIFASQIVIWYALGLVGIATGIGALLLYYRWGSSKLWIPQGVADYLNERSQRTKRGAEAFGLGLTTGVAELPFIAAPLLFAAMILRGNPDMDRLGVAVVYALLASLPLIILLVLIGGGTKVSQLERWREDNRRFLHIISGVGLIILSLHVIVLYCLDGSGSW